MDPFRAAIHEELRRADTKRAEGVLTRWGRRAGRYVGWLLIQLLGRGGRR